MKEAIRPIPPNRNISAGYNSSMPRENMYSRIYAANIPEPIPIDIEYSFNPDLFEEEEFDIKNVLGQTSTSDENKKTDSSSIKNTIMKKIK